ncbi:hypothetical protein D9M73_237040 [compost metagenome]
MVSAIPWKTLGSFINEPRARQRLPCMEHSLGNSRGKRHILMNRANYMDTSTCPGAMTCALMTRWELRFFTRICSLRLPFDRASPGMRTLRVPLRAVITT